MQIYINNKRAALKEGTSFEYVSENRLFSGSDGYTLTITFPLRDCPENLAIFGHINRKDVAAQKLVFDCEIRDGQFVKSGCITIVEINEAEVKTQFLDGRSEQNFDTTFADIYINELDLGEPAVTSPSAITPANAWLGLQFGQEAVALPWVNDSSGNIQNCAVYVPEERDSAGHLLSNSRYDWHSDTNGLSWQPYLLVITKRICEAVGYSYDFSEWESREEYKFLLICNTLPFAWYTPGYARALPHWTVEEYFEKLELFLGCEFDFDHRNKVITFAFSQALVAAKAPVCLENVVEEHSTEVKVEDPQCDYAEARNLVYKECDHEMWKYYSCPWFIKSWQGTCQSYSTLSALLSANKWMATWNGSNMRGSNMNKLLYAADVDAYFIIRTVSRKDTGQRSFGGKIIIWQYKCILQPVNLLGGRIVDDSDDADEDEIEFVPAWIDYTDDTYGWCLYLSFSGYDESDGTSYSGRSTYSPFSSEWYAERNSYFAQTLPAQSLEAGEADKKAEYYDRIYIAWWDGALDGSSTFPPHPRVMNINVHDDWEGYTNYHFSLRLNDGYSNRSRIAYPVDPRQKATFKFLLAEGATLPDVRAVFLIRGKRYLCEKLTATFTEHGMSRLVKGTFYAIED